MTRTEKITEAMLLEKEIENIKDFLRLLEAQEITPKKLSFVDSFIKRSTTFYLFGIYAKSRSVQVRIPDKLVIEIAAKCQMWITELEKKADCLVVGD